MSRLYFGKHIEWAAERSSSIANDGLRTSAHPMWVREIVLSGAIK